MLPMNSSLLTQLLIIKPRLHDTTCCQAGLTNIQPVVKPVWQPVLQTAVSCIQPVVSCKRGLTVILRQTTLSDMTWHSHALIDSDSPAHADPKITACNNCTCNHGLSNTHQSHKVTGQWRSTLPDETHCQFMSESVELSQFTEFCGSHFWVNRL